MDKITKQKAVKYILLYIGKTFKSIWYATYNILMLIVYAMLLNILLNYYTGHYNLDINLQSFLNVIKLLRTNWELFWLAFFGTKLYDELRYI